MLSTFERDDFVVMALLDYSAAFVTVDHHILLKILENNFLIKGKALLWIKSYLSSRSYQVKINNSLSHPFNLKYGMPHGFSRVHDFPLKLVVL